MALRFLFVLIVFIHGLIHLMGFAKAFGYGNFNQLTKDISKTSGVIWLGTALLLLLTAGLAAAGKSWWLPGVVGAILSQVLIFGVWQDAKFGSIANLILLVAAVLSWGAERFEGRYRADVQAGAARAAETTLVTEADLQHLPAPVQQYLRYVGVLGKPRVRHYRVVFEGQMRGKGQDWFSFRSEQHNFADEPTRLFFMKGRMFGLTIPGYHAYKNGRASMEIKAFGLVPIVDLNGDTLDRAETVTIFNDMCLLAPATLIDPRIRWEAIDSLSARAVFTVNNQSIRATLYFNKAGQLVNFISDDRYDVNARQQFRFSTPVHDYREINGYRLPSVGDAIWHYPEGDFVYGKFNLKELDVLP